MPLMVGGRVAFSAASLLGLVGLLVPASRVPPPQNYHRRRRPTRRHRHLHLPGVLMLSPFRTHLRLRHPRVLHSNTSIVIGFQHLWKGFVMADKATIASQMGILKMSRIR